MAVDLVEKADKRAVTTTDSADAVAADWVAPPSPLLAIDRNRATVIDRIAREWGNALASTDAGVTAAQLRELLSAMRADQLLAASLAGNLEGLRNVVSAAIVEQSAVKPSRLLPRQLGDQGQDVVYTPVVPCRLVDTRPGYPAVYAAGGVYAAGQTRNYAVQGGNGQCLSQLPGGLGAAGLQIQVFGIPANGVSGDIEVLPQGSTFGNSATLVVIGNIPFTSGSTTTRINPANNQIGVQVRSGIMHVAIDVVGYFVRPQATPLQCLMTEEVTKVVATGYGFGFNAAACPAGYTRITSSCRSGTSIAGPRWAGSGNNNTQAFDCQGFNDTGIDHVIRAGNMCCRVPGR